MQRCGQAQAYELRVLKATGRAVKKYFPRARWELREEPDEVGFLFQETGGFGRMAG